MATYPLKSTKRIECNVAPCKATEPDEDAATEAGWFLNTHGAWFCYQHNPTLHKN